MKIPSEEENASLFTIEKVSSMPSPLSMLSGCALCEHCTLLRLLAKSRLERGNEVCRSDRQQKERV